MAVTFTPGQIRKHTDRARGEGIRVKRDPNTGQLFATSATAANVLYELTDARFGREKFSITCNCAAGRNGGQCKHAAAALTVEIRDLKSRAARAMRRGETAEIRSAAAKVMRDSQRWATAYAA